MDSARQIDAILAAFRLSPTELARHLGVSDAAVSRWRSGRNIPKGLYAEKLASLHAAATVRTSLDDRRGPGPLIAELLNLVAPAPPPGAGDYERGYREGYRAALAALLQAATIAPAPPDLRPDDGLSNTEILAHDRDLQRHD